MHQKTKERKDNGTDSGNGKKSRQALRCVNISLKTSNMLESSIGESSSLTSLKTSHTFGDHEKTANSPLIASREDEVSVHPTKQQDHGPQEILDSLAMLFLVFLRSLGATFSSTSPVPSGNLRMSLSLTLSMESTSSISTVDVSCALSI